MSNEPASLPHLMWANMQEHHNVLVLTAEALFQATVKPADLAGIDLALEDGKPAEELMPKKACKVPLADIERIQFKQVRKKVHELVNKDVIVYYRDGAKTRSLTIQTDSEALRDEIVHHLNRRLGDWPIHEAPEAAMLILARYLWIMFVVALLTVGFCWLLAAGVITRAPSFFAWYINLTGLWGIMIPGVLICIIILINGIRQLLTPPIIVTYEPESE